MKRFEYRLERLLNLRRHREKEAEVKLGEATSHCAKLNREILESLEMKGRAFSGQFADDLGFDSLIASHHFMSRMDQQLERKHSQLVVKQLERDEAQQLYMEASRDRKVLDRVKERRKEEHNRERRLEETKQNDDICTGRAGTKGPRP